MVGMIERGLLGALRKPVNPAAILIMAVYTILWGLWIAAPWWDVFASANIYKVMSLFPEPLWGATAMVSGVAIMRGALKRSRTSLEFGSFIGFIHWFVIAGMYFIGDWRNTGGITSMMVSAYCAYIYLNLRLNRENIS